MASVNTVLGLGLIAGGLVIATLGHKRLPIREGLITRAVQQEGFGSKLALRMQSVVVGVLLVGSGLLLILQ
jgi:hypothetical protein